MTPESKLNWSTVKPTFPEVKGKKLRHLYIDYKNDPTVSDWTITDKNDYDVMFEDFICYADLTAPVSPLPLWGKLPVVESRNNDAHWIVIWGSILFKIDNEAYVVTKLYPTRDLAILAWNRIAEALNEVER